MHTERDTYLRLRVRKQNWLRLEQYRRICTLRTLLWRALLRSLLQDAGLSSQQHT